MIIRVEIDIPESDVARMIEETGLGDAFVRSDLRRLFAWKLEDVAEYLAPASWVDDKGVARMSLESV